MTFTNQEMGTYIDIFSGLHETGKLGYAIARNQRRMTDAAKEYMDLRAKLFQEYGTVKGQTVMIDQKANPEGYAKYLEEMGDIPSIESEVDVFKVDPETFYSGHLTSAQMSALLWMVDDTEEE